MAPPSFARRISPPLEKATAPRQVQQAVLEEPMERHAEAVADHSIFHPNDESHVARQQMAAPAWLERAPDRNARRRQLVETHFDANCGISSSGRALGGLPFRLFRICPLPRDHVRVRGRGEKQ